MVNYIWGAVALFIFGLGWLANGARWEAKYSDHIADDIKQVSAQLKADIELVERYREAEKASQERVERLAQAYQEDLAREKESSGRLVSDLRTGNVKLHSRWQACIATDRLSEADRAASSPDDAARDREGSASRVIGAADRDAAKIRALQRYAESVSE